MVSQSFITFTLLLERSFGEELTEALNNRKCYFAKQQYSNKISLNKRTMMVLYRSPEYQVVKV